MAWCRFKRKIYVDWNPPGVVELQFAVYDVDEEADALKNKDLIGMMDVRHTLLQTRTLALPSSKALKRRVVMTLSLIPTASPASPTSPNYVLL